MAHHGRLGIQRLNGVGNAIAYGSVIIQIQTHTGSAIDLVSEWSVDGFPNSMLAGLAVEAWREMQSIHRQAFAGQPTTMPGAMTALLVGGEIYLSSSIKCNAAGIQVLRPGSLLAQTMYWLSTDWTLSFPIRSNAPNRQTGAVHRTGGNCGECSAIHVYLTRHPDADDRNMPPGTRVVTVNYRQNNNGGLPLQVAPPCNPTEGGWGCQLLTQEMRIRSVNLPYMFAEFRQMTHDWFFTTAPSTF
jgi:hypothetical protein